MENDTIRDTKSNHKSNFFFQGYTPAIVKKSSVDPNNKISEIVFLTFYPPRKSGIATYSQDLMEALLKKFGPSFKLTVLPLELKRFLDGSALSLPACRQG